MSKEKAVDSRVDITNLPDGYERVVQGSTMPGESVFQYSQTPGEKVFKNGDAYIVLGKDNPGGGRAGHAGETNAATVDLVVGRFGDVGKEYIKDTLATGQNDIPGLATPNFKFDSARIYVSQKTDIDDNFYISDLLAKKGSIDGASKNKSAIGMKADGIRLISRESIKLVTMPDRYSSKNRQIGGEYGIELIAAANSTKENTDLQPMVKGQNLVDALTALLEHVATLDTQIAVITKIISQQQLQFTLHSHGSAVGPTTPPIDPNSFTQGLLTTVDNAMQVVETNLRQFQHAEFKTNYLTPGARRYICSPHNKTT